MGFVLIFLGITLVLQDQSAAREIFSKNSKDIEMDDSSSMLHEQLEL